MQNPARLFHCARCHRQVVICSRCDRGQIYCGADCAQSARRESLRQAGRRYQGSRRGRHRHAERQRRYRRRGQEVTHQGSPPLARDASLRADSEVTVAISTPLSPAQAPEAGLRCGFCARLCGRFVRRGFLRRRGAFASTPILENPRRRPERRARLAGR
jgi:hypothetical protein